MFKTLIVKCLSDNYAYVCYNENNEAFVVDPSEASDGSTTNASLFSL